MTQGRKRLEAAEAAREAAIEALEQQKTIGDCLVTIADPIIIERIVIPSETRDLIQNRDEILPPASRSSG